MVQRTKGTGGEKGVQATSPRSRMRPEVTVEEVVAMAGGVKLPGARGLGPRGHET